jgi:hypothetical protein
MSPELRQTARTTLPNRRKLVKTKVYFLSVILILTVACGPSATTTVEHPTNQSTLGPFLAGETEPVPPASTGPESDDPDVLEFLASLPGLSNWTLIPLGDFRQGNRRVMVIWPAINSAGQLVDATVVAVPLQRSGAGQLEETGRRWVVRDGENSRAALRRFFGSNEYQLVTRQTGVALDELGPGLVSESQAFTVAVAAGQRQRAQRAAVAFSRLLPLERTAYEPNVARLLWMAATHQGHLEHLGTEQDGNEAEVRLRVARGRVSVRSVTAQARPVDGQTDRWVIVSYEE